MRKPLLTAQVRARGRRATASVLSTALIFATVPPIWAAEPVLGTIQAKGVCFALAGKDWTKIATTRPLVAGDHLKTGASGNMLADLGELGVIGLYGDTELSVSQQGNYVVVDVSRGKVAFHLERRRLKVSAAGATLAAGTPTAATADGYVEFDSAGEPQLVVEGGGVNVLLADGSVKTVEPGQRLALLAPTVAPVAATTQQDERKAGPLPPGPTPTGRQSTGLSTRGWTTLAGVVVVVAVGVGVGVGVSDGGGGGGDANGSE